MTKAVRNRILKDANADISDHLRNHVHLTNCIHLKNHMHKNSPILADRSLMRDLIVLQRSRSLRDPSASPPSWHSPSVLDLLPKKGDKDATIREGRRSLGIERRSDGRRLSGTSPNFGISKVFPGEISRGIDVVPEFSDRSIKSGVRDSRRLRREEESSRKTSRINLLDENEEPRVVSENSESIDRRSKQKGKYGQDVQIRTLSEQFNNFLADDDDVASSNNVRHSARTSTRQEKTSEQPEVSVRGYAGRGNRAKRRKFRGARRTQTNATASVRSQNELSVASNTLAQGSVHRKYHINEEEEDYENDNVTRAPRNGCGIPFNWSRIHHRGKTFLDKAGKSFSCGLSDSRLRKNGTAPTDMPVTSDHSSSSPRSDGEALPLLVEASLSQESENAAWVNDYSGELGIFAENLLKHETDSDLASEARSGDQHKFGGKFQRHQNLTQKYMPRTFRDIVGQNLVSQALSNAVLRKKVGILYVFYGPHGTGKTSCARIFARALNCQSQEHPKPCGFCNSCVSHDRGKSRHIREIGPVGNFDFEGIMDLLDSMIISQVQSQYRVFIFDDCDTLSPDCWNAISKVIDRAPRRVVFVLVCSSLDVLPHIIISRCQKFFFPKLKDADIIYTLQWIASREGIEIDKEALKLIASRSDGSLRDAEMTLEQLSLLGQRISLPLVQELVGLISDEKLVDLLDLALSADTVNTVKNLRVIMETGVEPLALMSQLATVITDILAGSYDFTKERQKRRFFRRKPLSKEDMEKLRQALKTLSGAEKQLRTSNDKLTWLTAALLQLAPDNQYMLPSSSADTSFNHSPLALNNEHPEMAKGLPSKKYHAGTSGYFPENSVDRRNAGAGILPQQATSLSADIVRVGGRQVTGRSHRGIDEIWLEVLEKIQINTIKEFLYREGKLISVSFGAATTVQLMFYSQLTKAKAERFSGHILQAFERVLGSPVTIEIRCELKKDSSHAPLTLPTSKDSSSQVVAGSESNYGNINHRKSFEMGKSEIEELPESPREIKGNNGQVNNAELNRIGSGSRKFGEQSQSLSIVRSKVSLASVIQQAEGCSSGWSRRKAASIAEKLEQENLRLEPRSRNMLCWKASRVTRRKVLHPCSLVLVLSASRNPIPVIHICGESHWNLFYMSDDSDTDTINLCLIALSHLKIRARRPNSLMKLVCCGKCRSSKSPR
ncbi:hypothetical protein ACFE04_003536 [Oxalis oulophora]